MEIQNIGTNFLQGFGVLGLTVALVEVVWRKVPPNYIQQGLTGTVFAIGIVGTMLVPFQLQEGIIFDLRHVFLILAGIFGGIPAIITTCITAIMLRIYQGGDGQTAGIWGILIASGLSVFYYYWCKKHAVTLKMLASIGVSASLFLLGTLALPQHTALYIVQTIGFELAIINLIGVLIAGHQLNFLRNNLAKQTQLESASTTDPLTGLLNRRALETMGQSIAIKSNQQNASYAVFVIDIDHFKSVNDTFGHSSGDDVLINIAKTLSQSTPPESQLARYGGEEFVIIVPNANKTIARSLGEKIRARIEKIATPVKGISLSVTASVGFTVIKGNTVGWSTAFEQADTALYRAKNAGRNRVVSNEDEVTTEHKRRSSDRDPENITSQKIA